MRFLISYAAVWVIAATQLAIAQSAPLPDGVREARELIAAQNPTNRGFVYAADFEYSWHARNIIDAEHNPQQMSGERKPQQIRFEVLSPPVVTTGSLRVEISGESITVHVQPMQTAEEHLHLDQLRQPITIWRSDREFGEIRHAERSALIDVLPTHRVPQPDQLRLPHQIFNLYLAQDWQLKFSRPRGAESASISTSVRQDGDETWVSESYTWPAAETRYGPYSMERLTRYARVGDAVLPVEVQRILSGVLEASVEMTWPVSVATGPDQPLMPDVIRFKTFAPKQHRDDPLILWTEQVFRTNWDALRFGPNSPGQMSVPDGYSVLKRYPKGDPRETEEYLAGASAAASVAQVDQRWLLVAGTIIVLIMIVAAFSAALRKARSGGNP